MARILLVEDDLVQLDMWRVLLERSGHQVTAAASRQDAVSLLVSEPPEIMVMDWGLPQPEDGRKLLAETRRVAPGVRIVVLTGWNWDHLSEDTAVDEVLGKPVRVEQLLEALKRLSIWWFFLAVSAFAGPF
jgi:DNA-binding response OmpR family regulator